MTSHSFTTILLRGLRGRCPNCGKGKLFYKFLKVADHCLECQEPFHHHRADDAPSYLVILLTGHILVPLVAWVEIEYQPPYLVHLALWLPACFILSVGLLQPMKGLVVAFQWHIGLHDFQDARNARLARRADDQKIP